MDETQMSTTPEATSHHNSRNSQSFYPSEPFRISHFTMRHPVAASTQPNQVGSRFFMWSVYGHFTSFFLDCNYLTDMMKIIRCNGLPLWRHKTHATAQSYVLTIYNPMKIWVTLWILLGLTT